MIILPCPQIINVHVLFTKHKATCPILIVDYYDDIDGTLLVYLPHTRASRVR